MAGTTMTTMDSIFKNVYQPPMQVNINRAKVLLAAFKRAAKTDIVNEKGIIPIEKGRHLGNSARGTTDGSAIPTAGNVSYTNMTVEIPSLYATVDVTGRALDAASRNAWSFARALGSSIKGAEEGLLDGVNRQLNQDGSGILSRCEAYTGASYTSIPLTHVRYIQVGMLVDFRTKVDGTAIANGTSRTIEAIDDTSSPPTVDLDAAGGNLGNLSTNEGIYLAGNRNNEMMGIRGIIDNRDPQDIQSSNSGANYLQTVPVATNSWWKAVRDTSGTDRELTVALLAKLFEQIDQKSGRGSRLNMLFSRHCQWRKYGLLQTPDIRYAQRAATMDRGFKYLEYQGIRWYFDKDCEPNSVSAMDTDQMKFFEMAPLQWASREGHVLKWVDGYDKWRAFLYWYCNLGVLKRFTAGRLEALVED